MPLKSTSDAVCRLCSKKGNTTGDSSVSQTCSSTSEEQHRPQPVLDPSEKKRECLVAVSESGRNFALKEMVLLASNVFPCGVLGFAPSRCLGCIVWSCLVVLASGWVLGSACGAGLLLLGGRSGVVPLQLCSGVPCPSSRGRRACHVARLLPGGLCQFCSVSTPNRVRFPICQVVLWRFFFFPQAVRCLCCVDLFFPLSGLFHSYQPGDLNASSSQMSAYFHPSQRSF